jgi:hypothetical protein
MPKEIIVGIEKTQVVEIGVVGYSGYSGTSGYSGWSGYSGYSGRSGYSGYSGNATNHALLTNLAYNVAGHSGFQKALIWDASYEVYLIDH